MVQSVCRLGPDRRRVTECARIPDNSIDAKERETERIEGIYASGLSPCEAHVAGDLDAYIQRHVPGAAIVSITEFPSFSRAHAIRIVDQDLYFIEFNLPLYKKSELTSLPVINEDDAPKIVRSRLSETTVGELANLFANDISHAKTELRSGLDGTGYEFLLSGSRCGRAWVPLPGSRAAKLIDVFYMLGDHAALTEPTQIKKSEQNIYAAARALKVI